jgi:gamma-glutamyltranspeptidase
MAIALTVVEPTSNGIGSDAFAFEFSAFEFGVRVKTAYM